MAIGSRAEKAGVAGGILLACGAEVVDDFTLGVLAGHVEIAVEPVLGGDHGEEVVDRRRADFCEHCEAFSGRFGQVAHCSLSGTRD